MSFTPRQPNINSFNELNEYLYDLELRISEAFKTGELDILNLNILSVKPDKFSEGDILIADGDNYDPGSGKGLYRYQDSVLTRVG